MEKIFLKSSDDYELELHLFEVEKAKAVVQIIHGMEEHQGRYLSLVEVLNNSGFTVVTSDLRGHGPSAPDLGHFKDKDGDLLLIEDQKVITKEIKSRFEDLDVYIFAHSMGTIISRVLLETYSKNYKKVVLSGYPNYNKGAKLGIALGNMIKSIKGPKYKSKLLEKLSIGSFNRKIKNPQSFLDWISYNKENIKNYSKDPFCGIGFTCSSYVTLFKLVDSMHNPKNYFDVNADLEILMLAGEDDECTGREKGRKDSIKTLNLAGFSKIEEKTYPHMRHELLSEDNHLEVFEEIVDFYNS